MTQTNEFTDEVWNHGGPPDDNKRIDVNVRLVLNKPLYERFMYLIHNDAQLFREVCSTILNSNLENWAGKSISTGCPEVVLDWIDAALNKHMPLPEQKEED